MSKKLVIYHGGCPDGFTAAWACSKAFGVDNVELFVGNYGNAPPDVAGRDVLIVDFSYPRDILLDMHAKAASLRVIDHHKTAQDALADLDFATFDMERSGAGLTWDELLPNAERPWLVSYVEDRDLWRFRLPNSQHVSDCVMSFPYTLENWDALATMRLADAVARGAVVRGKIEAYCSAMLPNVAMSALTFPDGKSVVRMPVINAPMVMVSDLLHTILHTLNVPMAAAWFQRGDGTYQYGMRAQGDADVSEIAKAFGGGGHRQAAGFQVAAPVHKIDAVTP